MTLFVCWFVFPAVLALLALGCGLLLERIAGFELPGALVVPAGLAVLVVGAQFATSTDATAELAVPAVVVLAVAGFALSPARVRLRRVDRWALAAGLATFAAFAAPTVLSGQATFAGYIKLDDTATWLAMTDRVMDHGRSLDGLEPSSYEAALDFYLDQGYPVGSFLPLGVGGKLLGEDVAWLFQPYLAFLGAMIALTLYALGSRLVERPAFRAGAVVVASQAGLLYGYSLWGGVKEIAAAWVLPLAAALALPLIDGRAGVRAGVPLAVACAAALSILTLGGGIWLFFLLVPALAIVLAARGFRAGAAQAGVVALVAGFLSIPALAVAEIFLQPGSVETLTSESELGNLVEPLSTLQLFGIWPAGDFRFDPDELGPTYVMIGLAALGALLGLQWAWRRRAWGLLVYLCTAVAGALAIASFSSPWVDGKAFATASPALLLFALLGAAGLFEDGRRVEAGVLAAVVAGGVLWSNTLAYHDVNLAPRDRLVELEQIGEVIADEGPSLMTDYEPYGVRHFLREADAEGASELRRREVPLRGGGTLEKLESGDIDEFELPAVLAYRNLVLRRSPQASRPPSVYRLRWSGRFYEVWQRPETGSLGVVEHLPGGDRSRATGAIRCDQVVRAARLPATTRLAAAIAPEPVRLPLARAARTGSWTTTGNADTVSPSGGGRLEATALLPHAGDYGLWLGGSFRSEVEVSINGRHVASDRHELSHSSWAFAPLGAKSLPAGPASVVLRYGGADLHPGSGGEPFPFGPLVLTELAAERRIVEVAPRRARSLCGKRVDWVEALGSGGPVSSGGEEI